MRSTRAINIGLALILVVIVLLKVAMLYGSWHAAPSSVPPLGAHPTGAAGDSAGH